jgi:hypothetical protein
MKFARYAATALLAVSFCAAAPLKDEVDAVKWDKAKKAYIQLLSYNNPGVKSSAANFIRKYNIIEATEALKDVLMCDNCEAVKVSAALALLKVAGDEGAAAIRNALRTEENETIVAFYKVLLHENEEQNSGSITRN